MEAAEVEALLNSALELDEVHVKADGSHYQIVVVGTLFDGMSRVKQQQAVYAPLKEKIADGTIHAVSIRAFTPESWKREKMFVLPL